MKKFLKKKWVEKTVSSLLVFFLALCIAGASLTALLRFTFFNPSFVTDSLNQSEYYRCLKSEIGNSLESLGDASGLEKGFFDDVVDELIVREDVQDYVDCFYSDRKLEVNTTRFENKLRDALENYRISQGKGSDSIKQDSINYFVREACKVYEKGVRISYFKIIRGSDSDIIGKKPLVTVLMIVLGAAAAGIIVLMLLTQRWKHIAVRRIYYAVTASGLFLLTIPTAVFASGIIGSIYFPSPSTKELYITLFNTFFGDVLTIAVTLLITGGALCVIHLRMRNKARE